MKSLKEILESQVSERVHYTRSQIDSCLKTALKGVKNGLEMSNDMKIWEDWESASRAIAQLLQNSEDPETSQYILEYIAKNY
jgi:sensor domain CHASE-containing protein